MPLAGFYQSGFQVHRDLVETGFLLDFFNEDRARIARWKSSLPRDRIYAEFKPSKIRAELDRRDGVARDRSVRRNVYSALCEMASHPTYHGNMLLAGAPGGLAKIGPFFSPTLLELTVNELVVRFPHIGLRYVQFFPVVTSRLLGVRAAFLAAVAEWFRLNYGREILPGEVIPPDEIEPLREQRGSLRILTSKTLGLPVRAHSR